MCPGTLSESEQLIVSGYGLIREMMVVVRWWSLPLVVPALLLLLLLCIWEIFIICSKVFPILLIYKCTTNDDSQAHFQATSGHNQLLKRWKCNWVCEINKEKLHWLKWKAFYKWWRCCRWSLHRKSFVIQFDDCNFRKWLWKNSNRFLAKSSPSLPLVKTLIGFFASLF